jgi:hypothetical protein
LVKSSSGFIRVYVDGSVQFAVRAEQLLAFQAFNDDGYYQIEFHTYDKIIVCQYQNRDMWIAVLNGLDKEI